MFVFSSFFVQFDAVASAGVCRATNHIGCYHIEYRSTFASDFPDGIALFVSSDLLKESESVYLQTCVVLESSWHQNSVVDSTSSIENAFLKIPAMH